jgi:serine/threonine protein phosphatase PrpC
VTATAPWRSFGASVIGPRHVATGKPNQDAWSSFHHLWGDGIAVSDGLGSKPLSGYGSAAACRAVERAARRLSVRARDVESAPGGQYSVLLADILAGWLDYVAPLDPQDTSATCLFAFRLGDGLLRLGRLGDGCAAVIAPDGAVLTLTDDKAAAFSNVTSALAPGAREASWAVADVPEAECEAVVLCTDGIGDDLADLTGFMNGLVRANRGLARLTASRRLREMLRDWPTPKHSDDKTIACLVRPYVPEAEDPDE